LIEKGIYWVHKKMFGHLNLLTKDVKCITVGGIAHELAWFLLKNRALIPENAHCKLPHPAIGHRGWMTSIECNK
jgi:hypothetical protein